MMKRGLYVNEQRTDHSIFARALVYCLGAHRGRDFNWSDPQLELALRPHWYAGCPPPQQRIPAGGVLSVGCSPDCGEYLGISLEVNAESKPSWTRARSAAKKLLADCDTWDKAMRELAAKNLTELASNWLSQDEENPRNPETDPITEDELARRISLTSLSVTSGGSFTAWFDCDEMFTDHAVTVYGSLKKGLKTANIEG